MSSVSESSPPTIPALPGYPMPSTPVTNRVDWRPAAGRAALLIHDMQGYFLDKYDVRTEPVPTLVRHAQQLRAVFHALGAPVFYTAQPVEQPPEDRALLNDFWGPGLTAPQHRAGQPIIEALTPAPQDVVLTKWRYSAFQRSDLRARLQSLGRDQLVICGIYANIGCMATALEAFMQDVQPFLVLDAVADFSLAEHEQAIRYVSARCGVCLTTAEVADSLAPEAA